MRLPLLVILTLPCVLPGCINWQGGYDNVARAECRDTIDQGERRACFSRVEENASQRRADKRGG